MKGEAKDTSTVERMEKSQGARMLLHHGDVVKDKVSHAWRAAEM